MKNDEIKTKEVLIGNSRRVMKEQYIMVPLKRTMCKILLMENKLILIFTPSFVTGRRQILIIKLISLDVLVEIFSIEEKGLIFIFTIIVAVDLKTDIFTNKQEDKH